jgi:hypothetical protein
LSLFVSSLSKYKTKGRIVKGKYGMGEEGIVGAGKGLKGLRGKD